MEPIGSPSRSSSSRRPRAAGALALAGAAALAVAWPPLAAAPQAPPEGAQIVIHTPQAERLGIPDCVPRAGDEASREACRTLTAVLRRDLRFEGLFQFVSEPLLAAMPPQDPDRPNMEDWRSVNATAVVATRAHVVGGELTVSLRMVRVPGGQPILTRQFSGKADNPRYIAHVISDEVVAMTGMRGVAKTRIAFTSDRDATKDSRVKQLYIVDYDGHNPRRVTANNTLNILPAWSPDGRSLAFTSYNQRNPGIFRALIFEGRRLTITPPSEQAFAPSFSPDGKRIAYASNRSGNMEVWVANADGSGAQKLTSSPALDTAPTWSPTGREIAFSSDRTGRGSPQVYVMDADSGLNVRRLTTVGNYNDAPAWNPAKEFAEVAYTSRLEGGFEVAVVDLVTRQVRQITQGRGSCEYPSWAPSGRHLVFACKRGSTWQITVANRDGSMVEVLPAGPGNNSQPDWSP